ncbi:hypothetical protein, partial [Leptolyngbya sp. GGD]|uniref:hypothetical protein n=1 Tax=Leptolyngbya sp. GGD TaxID=2997907 RepID=UPI00227ACB3D
MSKFPHDDFAKAYLAELLNTIGKARPNRPLKAESRAADLWFELNPQLEAQRSQLGLLGRLLTRNGLIEVFRNAATAIEIRACQGKLISAEGESLRKAKRRNQRLTEAELPYLWLLMPTASAEIRQGFSVVETDAAGVYEFPSLQRIKLIVVHQLEKTEETLWLRLLGRENEQERAIQEFAQIPAELPLYNSIGDLLADYRTILETRGKLTSEEEELIMKLSAAYLKRVEEWKREGKQEGRQEGRQETVSEMALNMLQEGI